MILTDALSLLDNSPTALIVCVDVHVNNIVASGEVFVWESANRQFGEAFSSAVVTVSLLGKQATTKNTAKQVNSADGAGRESTNNSSTEEDENIMMKKEDPIGSVRLELNGGVQRGIEDVVTSNATNRGHITSVRHPNTATA